MVLRADGRSRRLNARLGSPAPIMQVVHGENAMAHPRPILQPGPPAGGRIVLRRMTQACSDLAAWP